MVGSPAASSASSASSASQTGSIQSVPDPAISSQVTTAAENLPSSSIQGASSTSRSTQVVICYKMIRQYWMMPLFYLKLTNHILPISLILQDTEPIVISSEDIEIIIGSNEDEPELCRN